MKLRRPFNGNYPLTQSFGANPSSYAKFGLKGHNGLDYGIPAGTPIVSALEGKVVEIANDTTGYGAYVKIENAVEGQIKCHLSRIDVKLGDYVYEGQQIGLSGGVPGTWGAGNTTGAHLHWGRYPLPRNRENGYSGYEDQAPLLISREEQAALPSGRTYVNVADTSVAMVSVPSATFEKVVSNSSKWDFTVSETVGIKDQKPEDVSKEAVKTVFDGLKTQIADANRRLNNIRDEQVDGKTVGYYITELANRVDQVKRLNDQITAITADSGNIQTTLTEQVAEKAKALGAANITIEQLNTTIRTLQTSLEVANTEIGNLKTELETAKTTEPVPETPPPAPKSLYDTLISLFDQVINALKGTKVTQG